ncbi:MAG: cation:proton antiporter subunit C [Defluviitaleaceae bacterium]|nr:cation:proton antiporter subunit C [Defluviitaleaceae bacterium]
MDFLRDFFTLNMFAIILFFISFFGIITSRNIVKSIIFIMLLQTAVIVFWLSIGTDSGTRPPIIYNTEYLENISEIVDPVPQALMLTAIIIGISVSSVLLTMLNSLFKKHHTADWETMTQMVHEEAIKRC